MDFAFYYTLVAFIWWVLAFAYCVLATLCFGIVAFVLYDLYLMIKERKKRRDGMQ